MKRAGLIALSMLLVYSLPAAAVSKNPYRRAQAQAKAPKPAKAPAITPNPSNPPLVKKPDGDPTKTWQSYSYP